MLCRPSALTRTACPRGLAIGADRSASDGAEAAANPINNVECGTLAKCFGAVTERATLHFWELNIIQEMWSSTFLEDIKYFFYITNRTDYCAEQIVALANERCDQENVIEQLKNGVNAMRMPVLMPKLPENEVLPMPGQWSTIVCGAF